LVKDSDMTETMYEDVWKRPDRSRGRAQKIILTIILFSLFGILAYFFALLLGLNAQITGLSFSDTIQLEINSEELGTGSDGAVEIVSIKDINKDSLSLHRQNADGIAYRINEVYSGEDIIYSYSENNLFQGLSSGDELLVINLQGNQDADDGVGVYEFIKIKNITKGQIVIEKPLINDYSSEGEQKIVVQRVPQYTDINITSGAVLTASPWTGLVDCDVGGCGTGIIVFRVNRTITISQDGIITTTGKGYRGGDWCEGECIAQQGESISGLGINSVDNNFGAGGGGHFNGNASGYGGHASYGTEGEETVCEEGCTSKGQAGEIYGQDIFTRIYLGSGGGGAAPIQNPGTPGGGIILLYANDIKSNGMIESKGSESIMLPRNNGQGSGGTILIKGRSIYMDNDLASVSGAGSSGQGRMLIYYGQMSGSISEEPIGVSSGGTIPEQSETPPSADESADQYIYSAPDPYFDVQGEFVPRRSGGNDPPVTAMANSVPVASNVVIEPSSGHNFTNANLTLTWDVSDADGDDIYNITNWYLNGSSITLLNLPFENNTADTSATTKDYSGNGHTGTVNGATWNPTGDIDGWGYYDFDGLDDEITVANDSSLDVTGAFSIEFWIKRRNVSSSILSLIRRDSADTYAVYSNSGSSNIMLRFKNTSNDHTFGNQMGTVTGYWQHIVALYNGTHTLMYRNGSYVGTTYVGVHTIKTGTNDLVIGRNDAVAGRYFNGSIGGVRVYNRALTGEQISALYNEGSAIIVSSETELNDDWQGCVTPNDGEEDGTEVCSSNLTIDAVEINSLDPLDDWVVNDTVKLECDAYAGDVLANVTLWHNYTGTWHLNQTFSASGDSETVEKNFTGLVDGTSFIWACGTCDTSDRCDFTSNRTLTIDTVAPTINFVSPTPANNRRNSSTADWLYVNVSTSDAHNTSAFVDLDNSLRGWWRFEDNTDDSSIYSNDGTCAGSTCPEVWTGARGKAYNFDGSNDYVNASGLSGLDSALTVTLWFKAGSQAAGGRRVLDLAQGSSVGMNLVMEGSNGRLRIDNSGGPTSSIYSAASYDDSTWHHVTMVRTATPTYYLYVDGGYEGSSGGTSFDYTRIYVGASSSVAVHFDGQVDDVMVWDRAFSPEEINASYMNHVYALERNFTSLASGLHNYTAYVVDMAGNMNQTDERNFSVNNVPVVSDIVLNATSVDNYTTDNLTVYYTSSDSDSDDVKNITDWRKNSGIDLLTDGDMEAAGTSSWPNVQDAVMTKQTTDPHGGSRLLRVTTSEIGGGNQYPQTGQQVLEYGKWYRVRGYARSDGTMLPRVTGGGPWVWNGTNSTDWQYFDVTFTPSSNLYVLLFFSVVDPAGTEYTEFDDVSVEEISSIAVLNMPFEATGGNESSWVKDYSSFSNHGTINGVVWNRTGGYDNRGAYEFNGSSGTNIDLGDDNSLAVNESFTISCWVNFKSITSGSAGAQFPIFNTEYGTPKTGFSFQQNWNQLYFYLYRNGVTDKVYFPITGLEDQWMHLAGVKDGDDIAIFKNGQLMDSDVMGGDYVVANTSFKMLISMNGTVDDVLFFNRSLSQEQIQALYENRTDLIVSEETSVYDEWRVCVTPNDGYEDGGEQCSNTLGVENAMPVISEIVLNATSVNNYTTDNLTAHFTVSDDNGEAVKNITNWYLDGMSITALNLPFEANKGYESSWTKDYSNFSNHGTVIGAVWNSTGGYDDRGAYEFDGVDDYVNLSSDASLDFGANQDFSISSWFKTSASVEQHILSRGSGGSIGSNVNRLLPNGRVQARISNSAEIYSPLSYNNDVWHLLTVTHDRDVNGTLYVDGVKVDTKDISPQSGDSISVYNWGVGIEQDGTPAYHFNGTIDDLRIWNRSLSAEQVLALYSNRTDLIVSQETSNGDDWQICVIPNDGYEDGLEQCSNVLSLTEFIPPTQTSNNGAEGTNLSPGYDANTIQSVTNYVWHSQDNGFIRWKVSLNLSSDELGGDNEIDDDIEFGSQFVSVNSTTATAFSGKAANITFSDVDCDYCDNNNIIYTLGMYSTLEGLRSNGQSCVLSGKCSNFVCSNPGGVGDCTFDVTGFTGYAYGGNVNLTINDNAEGDTEYTTVNVTYYAYYVNATTGALITGASCNVTDPDGTQTMSEGATYYDYVKDGGYSSPGIKEWNVTCNKAGVSWLLANDTIIIETAPESVNKTSAVYSASVVKGVSGSVNESTSFTRGTAGGNATSFSINTVSASIRWQGYYGEVTASVSLGDSAGNQLYDYGFVNPSDIKTVFASTDANFNFDSLYAAKASDVDYVYGWSTGGADSVTNTLNDGVATIATVSNVSIANLSSHTVAGAREEGVYQSGAFKDVLGLPYSSDNLAYGVSVTSDRYAFNNITQVDYEMVVPVDVGSTQTYYFYMDIT